MFGVSRQVYYRAKKSEKQRRQKAEKVIGLVQQVRLRMPRIGSRKLYHLLYDDLRKIGIGRDRLFAIMRANHMCIIPKRQYHITTDSHHRFRKHKNLIEDLAVKRPEQVWVSDITYIGTRKNPMYLALVTDAYSKKIMGYDVSNSLDTSGALRALKTALKQRIYKKALIHHSDRGLQYCSFEYQGALSDKDVKTSMTEQYDPYQNAVAERINGIIKYEFLNGIKVQDIELMEKIVNQSIQIYNEERPHLSCHFYTPNQMHQQSKIKIKTYKMKNSTKKILSAI